MRYFGLCAKCGKSTNDCVILNEKSRVVCLCYECLKEERNIDKNGNKSLLEKFLDGIKKL